MIFRDWRLKSNPGGDEPRAGLWFLRVASMAGIFAAVAGIGIAVRTGVTYAATILVFVAAGCAILLAWSWRDAFLAPFERAKRHVEGVEGDHRHEWYAFKGQRVRVFLDARQRPWFALKDVAFILAQASTREAFRHYQPHEIGDPAAAGETCLSQTGLRRLIKYSKHRDAGPMSLWLEREVLGSLANRHGRKFE